MIFLNITKDDGISFFMFKCQIAFLVRKEYQRFYDIMLIYIRTFYFTLCVVWKSLQHSLLHDEHKAIVSILYEIRDFF